MLISGRQLSAIIWGCIFFGASQLIGPVEPYSLLDWVKLALVGLGSLCLISWWQIRKREKYAAEVMATMTKEEIAEVNQLGDAISNLDNLSAEDRQELIKGIEKLEGAATFEDLATEEKKTKKKMASETKEEIALVDRIGDAINNWDNLSAEERKEFFQDFEKFQGSDTFENLSTKEKKAMAAMVATLSIIENPEQVLKNQMTDEKKIRATNEDYDFAKDNNIGETARVFCTAYWSCKESKSLKERWEGLQSTPETVAERKKELANLFDFVITGRFDRLPDAHQEGVIRRQDLTKFGAIGLIATILKVEADLHLNDDYWINIFFDVISDVLVENNVPEWIVKGTSLEDWNRDSIIEYFQQKPV